MVVSSFLLISASRLSISASRDINLLMRAYLVYVRPILEYNSVVWSPYGKHDIDAIERVQRRFTKRLRGYGSHSYSERLRLLELPSLELRRLRIDLIWCYKNCIWSRRPVHT